MKSMLWKVPQRLYEQQVAGILAWLLGFLKSMCWWFPVLSGGDYDYLINSVVSTGFLSVASIPEWVFSETDSLHSINGPNYTCSRQWKRIYFIDVWNDFSCATFLMKMVRHNHYILH